MRFTDRELEKIDALRLPGESRSGLVRRLLDDALGGEPTVNPTETASALDDLGPLEDEPAAPPPSRPAFVSGPVEALLRAVLGLAVPLPGDDRRALLLELRRVAQEMLDAETGR